MEKKNFYRKLPELIKSILITSEGWLVGTSISQILESKNVTDYDIIVPDRELFQIVTKQLSVDFDCEINSYGGLKFIGEDGTVVDIWCEELGHFLMTANSIKYIYNHKRQIIIEKI